MEKSVLQDFYENRTVLVTGGTGFLGKILLEQLLRLTKARVYVLVRTKNGKGPKERLKGLFNDMVYQKMKDLNEDYESRVFGIAGDCNFANLGLSEEDERFITKNVEVVFHSAATVRFDEHLKTAYQTNVEGTKSLIKLCKGMEKLKAFIYVSTAYSNYTLRDVDEKIYNHTINVEQLEKDLYQMSDDEIAHKTQSIMGDWPLSYVFTKQICEQYIGRHTDGVPTGIFRPSIITGTIKEPVPGWIDNVNGPTILTILQNSGLLKVTPLDYDKMVDMVPVDYCVACLIATAWDVHQRNQTKPNSDVTIYNFVSSPENPMTWGEYATLMRMHGRKYPFSKYAYPISLHYYLNESVGFILRILYHYIPALILDLICVLLLKKPTFWKRFKKIGEVSMMSKHFTTKSWNFTKTNVVVLWKKLPEKDRVLFDFNTNEIRWFVYLDDYIRGIRKYILKDPMNTVDVARKKQKRNLIIFSVIKTTLSIIAYKFLSHVLWP